MKTYKFRSAAQIAFAFDIIINRRLFCSDWRNLNDPIEGMFFYGSDPSLEPEVSKRVKEMALPQIEWVDYRMSDERQRPIRSDSGHQESVAGIQC
jgi:hypothetical protein